MKTSYTVLTPEAIEIQMCITASIKVWDSVMRALPRNNPDCLRLNEEIQKMLGSNRVNNIAITSRK